MKTLPAPMSQESETGKYVIIKVPRDSIVQDEWSSLLPFLRSSPFRTTLWIFLCIISFILGLAIGSVFHDRFLHETTDKPIWKSSSLQSPAGR